MSAYQPAAPSFAAAGFDQSIGSTQPEWFGYSTPVRVRIHGGSNYAEPDSFVSFSLLKPLDTARFTDGSEQIFYLDARAGLDFNGGLLGNFGLGQRHYFSGSDTILDGNVWYDIDDTQNRLFHQIAAGGQIQNRNLLLRGHYYLPIGTTRKTTGYTDLSGNSAWQGNSLALERFRLEQEAFEGFDTEVGFMWTVAERSAQLLIGYYSFQAKDAEDLQGFSGTLGTTVVPSFTVQAQVTHDDRSDTSVMVTATYEFYSGRTDESQSIRHRLGENIRRNYHIVSRTSQVYDPVLATDATDTLLSFVHASSTGGVLGTFESPFADLSQAATAAAATPNSIILAHAGSVFDGQSVVLPADTRFLGEGVPHVVTTSQLGLVTLPPAAGGSVLPIIQNSPGAAITLANNTEVNGFRIQTAVGDALFADGLTGTADILNTTVDGAATGLHVVNNAGTLTMDNLLLSNTVGSGVHVETSAATSVLDFRNSLAISNAGLHGIHLDRNAAGSLATFAGAVNVTNTTGHGIVFDDNDNTAMATFNGPTTVQTIGGSGVVVSNIAAAASAVGNVEFVGPLTVTDTVGSGIDISDNASNVSIQTLQVSNWNASAISIDAHSGNFAVIDPLLLNNANGVLTSTIQITNSTGSVDFGDVTITDTTRAGGGLATVNLSANATSVRDIHFGSLNIDSANGVALMAQDVGATVSTLVIDSGTIRSTNGTAIHLENLATDITLQSVSASNATEGIRLVQLGQVSAFHQGFRITGINGVAGSGGVMTGVQRGVVVDSSDSVLLQYLDIDSSIAGVQALSNGVNEPENLLVDNVLFTNTGNDNNWVGVDVAWTSGAHFGDPTTITNNVFTSAGAGQTAIRIVNNDAFPALEATIGGNMVNLAGAGSNGISLTADGLFVGQVIDAGDIHLTTGLNNIINVTGSPFLVSEVNDGQLSGQILVNGVLTP
ncbi:MAG: inverse autotransporter beta domain-containing protein [Planctomycetaceae bacterium]